MSGVRLPAAIVDATAASTAHASASSPSEWRSSNAALRIVPIGFADALVPAMSGAEPWIGSYEPAAAVAEGRARAQAERACEDRGLVA